MISCLTGAVEDDVGLLILLHRYLKNFVCGRFV